jgi:hypothetical protein
MDTIRIKSTDEASQGPFVVINSEDFDADKHELFDAEPAAKPLTVAELRDTLTARGIEFDPTAKKADLQALLDAAG